MKYILKEGIKLKNQFFTSNDLDESEEEKTKLANGKIVYKILGYADSVEEAIEKLYKFHLNSKLEL